MSKSPRTLLVFGAIFVYSGSMEYGNLRNRINNYVIMWSHLNGEQVVTTVQGASPRQLSERIHAITEEGFITQVVMVDRVERVVKHA